MMKMMMITTTTMMMMIIIIMMMITTTIIIIIRMMMMMIIENLIYIAQFDTNGIITALYIVIITYKCNMYTYEHT